MENLAARKKKNPMDAAIEQAYYRLAVDRQINIMDIGHVFDDSRKAIEGGAEVDAAVQQAIDKYCLPKENVGKNMRLMITRR